jgi:hypothetical protein
MLKRYWLLALCFASLLSCAHQPPATVAVSGTTAATTATQAPETAIVKDPPERPEEKSPPETATAAQAPERPEEKSPMEQALALVKQNKLDKYFVADKDLIVVKADITVEESSFAVRYDVSGALPVAAARYRVPFSIMDAETGETRDDTLEWNLEKDAAGLLLSFDDDYDDSWERNFDLFDRYGAKVTFFVQGRFRAFCTNALARGHDVGYHTIHHLNLPKVSEAVFFEETTSDIDTFRRAGVPLTSFAYPFGLSEPWMDGALFPFFKILRGYGVTFRIYRSEAIRKGSISCKAIDNILYSNDDDFKALITLMLRTVKFIGGVLPLCTHTIAESADWGIKPARLEYLLQSAGELGLVFYRYKDFQD